MIKIKILTMKVIIITTNFGFIALNEKYDIEASKMLYENTNHIEAIVKNRVSEEEIELNMESMFVTIFMKSLLISQTSLRKNC